jgi:hypothetical protein
MLWKMMTLLIMVFRFVDLRGDLFISLILYSVIRGVCSGYTDGRKRMPNTVYYGLLHI